MAFQDDIAGDAQYFDGGKAVTLRQIRPDGITTASITNATDSPLSKQRATFSGIEITGEERQFSLAASEVGTAGVNPQDIITDDDGETWRVLSADLRTLDTRWMCVCRKQH
jgi:hypothetical protein